MVDDSASGRVGVHLRRLADGGRPGDRLPSVRQLMAELGVSPATVRAAVAELVREGRVDTVSGSGTFIAHRAPALPAPAADRSWQTLALGPYHGEVELVVDLLEPLRSPPAADIIDLASGYPADTLQPTALITRAMAAAARRPGTFGRTRAEGIEALCHWFAPAPDREVLVVGGGQEGLSLIFRALGLAGEPVLMESPTYLGAIVAARTAGLMPVPVPADDDGVLVDDLDVAVRRSGARLVYLQPRFHNPTGATLAADRRAVLAETATRHGLIIIEDDWLIDLDDPASAPHCLAADDPGGHVVHLRSLTKSVAPALRVAGISATGAIARRLRSISSTERFFVSPILQHTALEVVTSPSWSRHLRRLRAELAQRRDCLRRSLDATGLFDDGTGPGRGGPLHLWLDAPPGVDPDALRDAALRRGVSVVSGSRWFPGDVPAARIRLSAAAAEPSALTEGVTRLAAAVTDLAPRVLS